MSQYSILARQHSSIRRQSRAPYRVGVLDRVLLEQFAEGGAGQIARRGVEPFGDRLVLGGGGRLAARLFQGGDDGVRRIGGRAQPARGGGLGRGKAGDRED